MIAIIRKLSKFFAGIIAIGVLITAFFAYAMRTADIEKGMLYDGLGRLLEVPPWWARFFLTSEPVWAGTLWHLFDIVWFFGGMALAFNIYFWGDENKN